MWRGLLILTLDWVFGSIASDESLSPADPRERPRARQPDRTSRPVGPGRVYRCELRRLLQRLGSYCLSGCHAVRTDHYNNVNLPSSGLVLDDNTGTPTTALLTAISSGSGGFTTPVAGADEMLNVGAAATSNVSQSFTLANIPYSNYSLSVYDLGLGAGFVQGISLGNTTYYTSSPNPTGAGYLDDNNATPFTYTLGTSTSAAAPTANADYVLFTGLSGSTLTITETKTSGNLALLPGFQIIQVLSRLPGHCWVSGQWVRASRRCAGDD